MDGELDIELNDNVHSSDEENSEKENSEKDGIPEASEKYGLKNKENPTETETNEENDDQETSNDEKSDSKKSSELFSKPDVIPVKRKDKTETSHKHKKRKKNAKPITK